MARSSHSSNIQVASTFLGTLQANTINLTEKSPRSPAPSTPGTSKSQDGLTSKKRKTTSERSLTREVWSHFVKKKDVTAPQHFQQKKRLGPITSDVTEPEDVTWYPSTPS
ncbi:hypothetical protein H4Q26_002465 [Puccinia striiformis f. sp. tritici PST-130]|uniref:Uncharacterized protein n=1 Tax=Puccinia striiformis f. sp. tritici PST-78 TaxID=1165861 RepID=A0A0L0UUC9_9BASI|nr:hypothetical protein H4Q26_002465 [Puccinia striiformis f. sp. tritici PST-130]KNE90625.1 hypothetical protein PSTG_15943 [Puccinia striiformis f. sp. tritici PST-78]